MKTRARALTVAVLIAAGMFTGTAAANAHYDPWTTHWHYMDGQATYKMCSWWDGTFVGCQNENLTPMPIIIQ